METLKIGWSQRDMTPVRPAMIQGQMHRRIGRDAMDPLTVTALALEGSEAGKGTVLVSLDLAYINESLCRMVRRRVVEACPDIPSDHICLNATHTHTSFVYDNDFYEYPGGDVMTPDEAAEWIANHAAGAAIDAWRSRVPRRIGRAYGHAVVGHNRYAVYADGTGQMYGQTNRPDFIGIGGFEDHSLDMVFTWEPDGNLAGLLLAIPCPSQVDEHLERFSADYWHDVRVELRRRLGNHLQILPVCSAAGDQSPHLLVGRREEAEMLHRRGHSERQEIAERIGDAVERALRVTQAVSGRVPMLNHAVRRVELTALQPTAAHQAWARKAREEWFTAKRPDGWWPQGLQRVVDAGNAGAPLPPFMTEIHVIRLDDLVIATSPFELFQDYGMQIKARSPAEQTVTMQLANGRGMYLPTGRAIQAGGYGANPVVCPVGPAGGQVLVETTLAMIQALMGGS